MGLTITQEENRFHLVGVINEFANFQPLFDFKGPEMRINWKKLSRINSTGVREWIHALEKINQDCKILFEECPIIVVYQMNMIPNFTSNAKVESVYAPYYCGDCGHQEEMLIQISEFDPSQGIPQGICKECGAPLVFDDEEDSYFYFLDVKN